MRPAAEEGKLVDMRRLVGAVAIANVLCAPVSWLDDGVTPSWIVYPAALLIGLWRLRGGKGLVWLGVAAVVFLLVHVPWSFAFLFGGDHPLDADLEYSPVQWFLTLLLAPAALAAVALVAWRRERPPGPES